MIEYKYYIIYKTTNLINEKFYIGLHSTNDLNDGYIGSGKMLWNAVKKYGRINFSREIIEFCKDRKDMAKREIHWIKELKAQELGYNLAEGGLGGFISFEATQKTIKALKGKKRNKESIEKQIKTITGQIHSAERIKRNSEGHKGKLRSEEVKLTMRKPHKSAKYKQAACSHCSLIGGENIMKQYHFENCLKNPNLTEEQLNELILKRKRKKFK